MRMMTCREASEALRDKHRVSAAQIKRGCQTGKYPYLKIGNRILVDVDVIRSMLEKEAQESALLSTAELALRIGMSESTIRRAVSEGWMPCRLQGRNMRFDLIEVQKAITDRMRGKYSE